MKIAIQGQAGSFHDAVARRFFGEGIELVCCETFHELFVSLKTGKSDQAVCAIENSLYGSIADNYDLLLRYRFPIVGEAVEHVHQNLICLPGTTLTDITEVYSHPVAIDQCREWLENNLPDAEVIEHHDTAGAVEYVKSLDSPYAAAIAGKQAALLHDMPILVHDIEDETTNLTRFFVLDPHGKSVQNADKASLVLITSHAPGALYRALGVFAGRGVNLTKLESRPIRGEAFKYQFFVDAECNAPTLATIITELNRQDCAVVTLGHYRPVS